MKYIRRFLYKIGRRPKRGSIFHSPSMSITYGFKDAWKQIKKEHGIK